MPRIKLAEQSNYEFQHTVTVRVTDLNYGRHLGNDALVSLIHEARAQLLHSLDCSETDLGDHHTGLIMADLVINFVQEGFMFDVLQINSHVGEISSRGFRIFHRITKAGQLLALAETGLVAFDYAKRRSVPIPETFLKALNDYKEQRLERFEFVGKLSGTYTM
jgi:acyl-CoA thioester hydrolase